MPDTTASSPPPPPPPRRTPHSRIEQTRPTVEWTGRQLGERRDV